MNGLKGIRPLPMCTMVFGIGTTVRPPIHGWKTTTSANNQISDNNNTQRHTNINMKKALTVMALLAGAASVYSQGLVSMSDYGTPFNIQVFNQQSLAASTVPVSYGGYTGNEEMGQSANPNLYTAGSTVYAAGSALGTGYDVELLAAPGASQPFSSLVPTAPVITTWYEAAGGNPTASYNGMWQSAVNATISGAAIGTTATVAIAAWNNEGGTVNTLAAAQAAGDPWGVSSAANTSSLGGAGGGFPPNLPTSILSFSLATVPEPSTIALGVIGASTFLLRLRRKD